MRESADCRRRRIRTYVISAHINLDLADLAELTFTGQCAGMDELI
jgi:hypothetical protein